MAHMTTLSIVEIL